MYKLLSQTNPLFWALVPLLIVVLWFDTWMQPFSFPTGQYLYHVLVEIQKVSFDFAIEIIGGILLTVTAFLLNGLNSAHKLTDARGNLISVIFILLVAALGVPLSHPAIVSVFFLFFVIHMLLSLNDKAHGSSVAFNSSLLLALASLFDHNLLYFLPLIWLGILIIGEFSGRMFMVSILGFLLPFVYTFSFNYLRNDMSLSHQWAEMWALQFHPVEDFNFLLPHWLMLGVLGLLLAWGIAEFFGNYYKLIIVRRKSLRMLISVLFLSLVLSFALPSANNDLLVAASIPTSLLLARLITIVRKSWMREIIIALLIFFVAWIKSGLYGSIL